MKFHSLLVIFMIEKIHGAFVQTEIFPAKRNNVSLISTQSEKNLLRYPKFLHTKYESKRISLSTFAKKVTYPNKIFPDDLPEDLEELQAKLQLSELEATFTEAEAALREAELKFLDSDDPAALRELELFFEEAERALMEAEKAIDSTPALPNDVKKSEQSAGTTSTEKPIIQSLKSKQTQVKNELCPPEEFLELEERKDTIRAGAVSSGISGTIIGIIFGAGINFFLPIYNLDLDFDPGLFPVSLGLISGLAFYSVGKRDDQLGDGVRSSLETAKKNIGETAVDISKQTSTKVKEAAKREVTALPKKVGNMTKDVGKALSGIASAAPGVVADSTRKVVKVAAEKVVKELGEEEKQEKTDEISQLRFKIDEISNKFNDMNTPMPPKTPPPSIKEINSGKSNFRKKDNKTLKKEAKARAHSLSLSLGLNKQDEEAISTLIFDASKRETPEDSLANEINRYLELTNQVSGYVNDGYDNDAESFLDKLNFRDKKMKKVNKKNKMNVQKSSQINDSKGILSIADWTKKRDRSISGMASGSNAFKSLPTTTGKLKSEASSRTFVGKNSGAENYLLDEKNSILPRFKHFNIPFMNKRSADEISIPSSSSATQSLIGGNKAKRRFQVVPALSNWKQNKDGSLTGRIAGSPSFKDGEPVTTSPIVSRAIASTVVETESGSRYYLTNIQAEPGEWKEFEDAAKRRILTQRATAVTLLALPYIFLQGIDLDGFKDVSLSENLSHTLKGSMKSATKDSLVPVKETIQKDIISGEKRTRRLGMDGFIGITNETPEHKSLYNEEEDDEILNVIKNSRDKYSTQRDTTLSSKISSQSVVQNNKSRQPDEDLELKINLTPKPKSELPISSLNKVSKEKETKTTAQDVKSKKPFSKTNLRAVGAYSMALGIYGVTNFFFTGQNIESGESSEIMEEEVNPTNYDSLGQPLIDMTEISTETNNAEFERIQNQIGFENNDNFGYESSFDQNLLSNEEIAFMQANEESTTLDAAQMYLQKIDEMKVAQERAKQEAESQAAWNTQMEFNSEEQFNEYYSQDYPQQLDDDQTAYVQENNQMTMKEEVENNIASNLWADMYEKPSNEDNSILP
eukprot:CAMPEP_0184863570 /NCGR_PEP_ID=MMETSP0580-20130426/11670_1 /TAXON_ID=1118495 /ORGANISM="Dactyliosolen fragilissimus" /LENGTH=1088 /DNA_ID=CAMNT_0027361979 /DNA_START=79 /DNA_END=3345 /DNA_ORIENTATION=+